MVMVYRAYMYKRMGILLSPATAVCMLQLARDPSSFLDGCYWSAGLGSFFVTRETPECKSGLKQTGGVHDEEFVGESFPSCDYSSEVGLNSSFVTQSEDGSLYVPTPQKVFRNILKPVTVPNRVCFTKLSQLDGFVQRMNKIRRCCTPGCDGDLVPMSIKSKGLGGAVSIAYTCNGCALQSALFEASPKYEPDNTCEIGVALQVAFVVSGCMHATYEHVLKRALGIDAVSHPTFYSTIMLLYPVVKRMVDEICEEAKNDMKSLDPTQLGSWNRAVTSADGAWQTRGFHSKNATFSIRNYCNGALLYYKHLCQRGQDEMVEDDLYEGTSKSAEGYAARLTFKSAKDEGMVIEVQWQDSDSSSSKAVTEHFPNAKVMTCGGHAGRAHKKQLEKLSKCKSFSKAYQDKHCKKFPEVKEVTCCCEGSKHKQGCGCLSEAFVEKARNNFSTILMAAQSAKEFEQKITSLVRHARNEHEWEGGQCDFHPTRVCSCGACKKGELKCEGKPYRTRHVLSCSLHSLAYKIECDHRASMADQLVHPELKRGHSNWLEASHNVFIRFRPKHVHLERLHYETSTNLALLQSNMTYMYTKRGPSYHWIPDLYQRLKLPVYDGLREALEASNRSRMKGLADQKTDKTKKRRIQLKMERTKDAQLRKSWSKKHGHDTYGDTDVLDSEAKPKASKQVKPGKSSSGGKCKCGSTSHRRVSHRDCPMNKRSQVTVPPAVQPKEDLASEDVVDDLLPDEATELIYAESLYSDDSAGFDSDDSIEVPYDSEDNILDDIVLECTCGAGSRAHKRECPMSSRQRYCGSHPFAEAAELDSKAGASGTSAPPAKKPKRGRVNGNEASDSAEPPPSKRRKTATELRAGDYVSIHSDTPGEYHVPCRIAEVADGRYRLCCKRGVFINCFNRPELTPLSGNYHISLDGWRQAKKVRLPQVLKHSVDLEKCECNLPIPKCLGENDLPKDSGKTGGSEIWVQNLLYKLTYSDREIIVSQGWLNDDIITGAQLLMLQECPNMSGLQAPTLGPTLSFKVHRREFVQILHIGNNHWCVVSNVGCDNWVVNVYDSLNSSVSTPTARLIASLLFCSAKHLTIRMMDVEEQTNLCDCGVLAIAYAYDICTGSDPCAVVYDHLSIRRHLAKCLKDCRLSRFPVSRERKPQSGHKNDQKFELHCVCRLPELEGDRMAQCDDCEIWFHALCVDIPKQVFAKRKRNVQWICKACTLSKSAVSPIS